MAITMHTANSLNQLHAGNAVMAGRNDCLQYVHGGADLRAYRLSPNRMQQGSCSFLPVKGKRGFGRPEGNEELSSPSASPSPADSADAERMPSAGPTSSPLPPAVWAALVIHGAGSCAGRRTPHGSAGTPETVVC